METIKNLLRPGRDQDDQTLYNNQSTGNTANTTSDTTGSGLTGEGSHLAGTREGDVTSSSNPASATSHHSSGLTGQGSHFGSSTTGNDTLGSTSTTSGGHTGAGHREYDPQGAASNRGIHPVGGDQNQTYNNPQSTTVGPDSSAGSAARTATSDNSRSTDLGGITGASSATQHGSQPSTTSRGPNQSDNLVGSTGTSNHSNTAQTASSNTADRSITSDNDRSTALGGITGAASSTYGNHPPNTKTESGGLGSSSNASNTYGTSSSNTTAGPHQSDTLNRLDPRVDSDNSRSANVTGSSGGYTSTTGGSYHTGPTGSAVRGPHQTATANLLDPNLDNSSGTHREDAIQHYESSGGGAEKADHDHGTTPRNVTAGTVGLGALGLGSSSNESRFTNQGTSEVQREGHSLAGDRSGAYPESSAAHTGHLGGTTSQNTSGIPDRTRPSDNSSSGDTQHHYGRDAAIAGGAAGLAGAAYGSGHHADHNQSTTTQQPAGSSIGDNLHGIERNRGVGDSYPQTSSITSSSNQTSTAPTTLRSVDGRPQSTGVSTSTTQPHSSSILNKLDPRISSQQTQTQTETPQESHTGRNAALGASALGAGGAAYGASHHHDSHDPSTTTTSRDNSGLGSSGVGSGIGSGHDHTVRDSSNDNRTGIPGTGSLGTGSTTTRAHDTQPYSSGVTQTADPHSSDLKNRADPTVNSDRYNEKDHSYGRDAALLGAGGAAGYGASKLHDNSSHGNAHDASQGTYSSDLSNRGPNTATSSAPTSNIAHQTHQPHTSTTTTTTTNTSTTTAGPHSSNLKNELDPSVDSDRSKEKHHGRDAAAVGAAGTAAYGAHELSSHDEEKMRRLGEKERAKEQREHEKFVEKEEKHTDKHEKKEHKGLFSFLHRDKNKKYSKEEEDDFDRQEKDYDAQHGVGAGRRAVAGTAAGAGAGTYAAHQTHGSSTTHENKSIGSTIGDKLHGTHRNRGVPGDNPFPDGGGPNDGINEVTGQPFETSVVHGQHTLGTDGHHHTSGSIGATGTSSTTGRTDTTSGQYDTTAKPSATGLTSGTTSGPTTGTSTGIGHDSSLTGSNTTSTTDDSTRHDRNRLHKDPPAGHPASQV